eukprot:3810486-Rhodomonas_salina.1
MGSPPALLASLGSTPAPRAPLPPQHPHPLPRFPARARMRVSDSTGHSLTSVSVAQRTSTNASTVHTPAQTAHACLGRPKQE